MFERLTCVEYDCVVNRPRSDVTPMKVLLSKYQTFDLLDNYAEIEACIVCPINYLHSQEILNLTFNPELVGWLSRRNNNNGLLKWLI